MAEHASANLASGCANKITVRMVTIDVTARRVRVGRQSIRLSALEFDVLVYLACRPGKFASVPDLLRNVWGGEQIGTTNQVHCCLKRLRRKLANASSKAEKLIERHHKHYRMVAGEE